MRYRVSLEDGREIGVSRKMRTRVRLPLPDGPPWPVLQGLGKVGYPDVLGGV